MFETLATLLHQIKQYLTKIHRMETPVYPFEAEKQKQNKKKHVSTLGDILYLLHKLRLSTRV